MLISALFLGCEYMKILLKMALEQNYEQKPNELADYM